MGSDHHKPLLIHFLNALLGLRGVDRVATVAISDPFNKQEALVEKYSVVDIRVTDQMGRSFQVEIQNDNHPAIKEGILFNWAQIYVSTLAKGEAYDLLNPVVAIWLLAHDLFPNTKDYHLRFGVYSPQLERPLTNHCDLNLIQLNQWSRGAKIMTDKDRWLRLFRYGKDIDLNHPPDWMNTPEMKEVLTVMETFSEKGANRDLYLSRMDAERTALTIRRGYEQRIAKEHNEKLRERDEKLRERAEKLKFRKMLEDAGIDPDA